VAEQGAPDAEIEAVIPHAAVRLTRYYRARADQKRVAAATMAKLTDQG